MAEILEENKQVSSTSAPHLQAPETQKERWIKYGSNVVLSCLVVVALAVMLTWLAESFSRRLDTTVGGTQSLRAQSVNFIQDLKTPVRIVALYPRLKSDQHEQDYYQPVADLLNEYATKGKNIATEMIDPDAQKDQFNKLVSEVTNKYGGEVKDYKAILADEPAQTDALNKFVIGEARTFNALPNPTVQDQQLQEELSTVSLTLVLMHQSLTNLKEQVDSEINQQIPSYKDGVDDTKRVYSSVSQLLKQFSQVLEQLKAAPGMSKDVIAYAPGGEQRATDADKIADAMLDRISHLPPLTELDEFKDQLKSKSIIVMTDGGYRILSFDQVWKVPESSRFAAPDQGVQPRLTFAGEQQVTAAIAALTGGPRPMIVFVRPGGAPLATSMVPGQGALFSAIAQRLRDYNFDVQEKDASGQSQMQQQDMPPMPEPTAEQMKSAIWVVVRFPHDSDQGPSTIDTLLQEHLKGGGSAMAVFFPTAEGMELTLAPWGVHVKTDQIVVHDAIPTPERRSTDMVESALQASQAVFKFNQYGDHPIGRPLDGLDMLQFGTSPVTVESSVSGVTATGLLPIPGLPNNPRAWATSDVSSVLSPDPNAPPRVLKFNRPSDPNSALLNPDVESTADHPLYGAAAVDRPGAGRLVVVGSYVFATNELVNLADQEMMDKHGLNVARLPGNGEFFVNSIFWLARMDGMLAISPHALQVARIREMSPAALNFWRLGVMTAGLPALVVLGGLLVYTKRRD
jgi:hypothetical protein